MNWRVSIAVISAPLSEQATRIGPSSSRGRRSVGAEQLLVLERPGEQQLRLGRGLLDRQQLGDPVGLAPSAVIALIAPSRACIATDRRVRAASGGGSGSPNLASPVAALRTIASAIPARRRGRIAMATERARRSRWSASGGVAPWRMALSRVSGPRVGSVRDRDGLSEPTPLERCAPAGAAADGSETYDDGS